MRRQAIRVALLLSGLLSGAAEISAQTGGTPCGISPTDWCRPAAGDPCGRHGTERDCRADPSCRGMPYRGESVIACIPDGRGFWENCPAVGCVSRRAD